MRVLITGASGFIGAELVKALSAEGVVMRASYRALDRAPVGVDAVAVGDLGPRTDWRAALEDVDCVVHLASPAHAKFAAPMLTEQIVQASRSLAEQAVAAGVSRFVFISSIKAAAERAAAAITEDVAPAPADAYGRAKLEAERVVLGYATLRAIVLRPPLVHGSRATANFARLLRLADTPAALPFAGLHNARSMISVDALVCAIKATLAPEGAVGVYHIADQPALSTGEIVAALRRGLGRSPSLFAAPMLHALMPRPLTESLAIDDSKFRRAFNWSSTHAAHALEATARAWKAGQ